MVPIKATYFEEVPNVGDLLTPLISERLFNKRSVNTPIYSCELIGIGSILDNFSIFKETIGIKKHSVIKMAELVLASQNDTYVWSSGLMCPHGRIPEMFWHKRLVFTALRGELTKKIVENMIKKPLGDIPLGDGGLLSSLLVKKPKKKYSVGFVPHYIDIDNKLFQEFMGNYKKARLIDVKKEPLSVLREIASCEMILSSSLHGLIIADSFGIPNKQFVVCNHLRNTTEFKYRDYYSAFGLECKAYDCESGEAPPTLNQIADEYKVDPKAVEEKQEELYNAFPFK